MPAKINFKSKKEVQSILNEILERATLWLWARAVELAPRGGVGENPYAHPRQTSKAIGELSARLDYEINYDRMRGAVGLPMGDDLELLGWYNEYGTGPRGAQKFIRFGGEERPDFSLPFIVPKHASVLAWVTKGERPTSPVQWRQAKKEGRAVYAKKTKGMNPHPFLRPALFELQTVYLKDIALQVMKEHKLMK